MEDAKPSCTESRPSQSRWDAVCTEFADVFAEPTMPIAREITHDITLADPTQPPPKPRRYRMSAAELQEVRR